MGRHDASLRLHDRHGGWNGDIKFKYTAGWAELSTWSRVTLDPKPYWPEHKDKLRFQSVFFPVAAEFRGTSFLNIWDYDHSTFPVLYG